MFYNKQSKHALEGSQSLAIVNDVMEPGEATEDDAGREAKEKLESNCSTCHFWVDFAQILIEGWDMFIFL